MQIRTTRTRRGVMVETDHNRYAFLKLRGDTIRGGNKADIEGKVTYVGDSFGKHYVTSHDMNEVPDEVIEAVKEKGLTVVDNVDGGWANWDGRPEFSTNYVDISNAEEV